MAAGTKRAPTAAPEPDDEPPGRCFVFQGLSAGGQGKSQDGPPRANSKVAVLPMRIPPASDRFVATVASSVGTLSNSNLECEDERMSRVSMLSLRANGMPSKGPR